MAIGCRSSQEPSRAAARRPCWPGPPNSPVSPMAGQHQTTRTTMAGTLATQQSSLEQLIVDLAGQVLPGVRRGALHPRPVNVCSRRGGARQQASTAGSESAPHPRMEQSMPAVSSGAGSRPSGRSVLSQGLSAVHAALAFILKLKGRPQERLHAATHPHLTHPQPLAVGLIAPAEPRPHQFSFSPPPPLHPPPPTPSPIHSPWQSVSLSRLSTASRVGM